MFVHPIIAEELAQLRQVLEVIDGEPATSGPSEAGLVRELEGLRERMREGTEAKDQGALMQQWTEQSALLQR